MYVNARKLLLNLYVQLSLLNKENIINKLLLYLRNGRNNKVSTPIYLECI